MFVMKGNPRESCFSMHNFLLIYRNRVFFFCFYPDVHLDIFTKLTFKVVFLSRTNLKSRCKKVGA